MKEFQGKIIVKIEEPYRGTVAGHYPSPEAVALDVEVYLNGDVATEIFQRYGAHVRVHLKGEE